MHIRTSAQYRRKKAMIMRLTWGKLKPGTWDEYERKYKPVPFGQPVRLGQRGLVPVVSHSPLVGCG
jgi:hypothetical protein